MRTIHPFSPVVILTGQDTTAVQRELGSDAEEITVIEKGCDNWTGKLFSGMCNALDRKAARDPKQTFAELRAIIAGLKEKGYAATSEPISPQPA